MMTGGEATRHRIVAFAATSLIIVVCAIGISVPAGLGWDFGNFYDAGHRVAAGQIEDLYQPDRAIDGRAPQGRMRFWSAPLAAVLLAPLSMLRPTAALVTFKFENTLALFLALWLLYSHYRRLIPHDDDWRFTAAFASACLIYQPFWTVFRVGGQTTPTVFLLLTVAMLCYTSSRLAAAAALLTIVVMIKPTFSIMLVFLAVVAGPWFTASLVMSLVVAGLLSVVVLGWQIHEEFLKVLVEGSALSRSWLYNSSLYVPFENFRLLEATGSSSARLLAGFEWMIRLAIVALFVVIMRRSRRETWAPDARRHFEFLMAICFWLLISQLIWEHYLAILFIPLAYFIAVRSVFPNLARTIVTAIVVLAIAQNLIFVQYVSRAIHVESVPELIAMGVLKAGPLLLLVTLLGLYHSDIFRSYRLHVWTGGMAATSPLGAAAASDAV